jgi:CO/xanthine dehydrogenase Mo-binding subunit
MKSGHAGQDGLRPHGRSGRDHQAPSIARSPSHRARQRRQAAGHGHRGCHRWRRVLDAFFHCALARHAAFAGPYVCPNVRVRSHAWATNTVPYGAFRGFGAPQAIFAIERHMDEIAAAIGIDPIELRRRNFLHDGDTTATEQVMREPVILDKLLDRALARAITTPSGRDLRDENPPARSSAAWASPLSITAPDSPARASAI